MPSRQSGRSLPGALALLVLLGTEVAAAATFVVTTNADSGPGSLREALTMAGATDTVSFAITTPSKTIRPLTALPSVAGLLDGTTQPGYAGKPIVEIDGSLLPALTDALPVTGTVKGLALNRCPWAAITLYYHGRAVANFVGTDVTGESALANGIGVRIVGAPAFVGGPNPGDGNLISGNGFGILSAGFPALGEGPAQIVGNRIGTNAEGTTAIPNFGYGVEVENVATIIGLPGHGNLISGNGTGIQLFEANDCVVQGNLIGTDASGTAPIPGQSVGILIYASSRATIGGPGSAANGILVNGSAGIGIQPTSNQNRITRNSMWGPGLAIDLDYGTVPQVTPNDPCDSDIGPNLLQNFPVIAAATVSGGAVTVRGTLESEASSAYDLEFFSSPAAGFMGYGPGATYLGTATVTTGASCQASFQVTFPVDAAVGSVVTATATDSANDTSEFSAATSVAASAANISSISPASGAAAGSAVVTITGSGFQNGATVTFGDMAATGVSVDSATQITATVPSLPPGSLSTVVVTNPDFSVGSLANAWFADFLDVPAGHPFHAFVENLVRNGVTAGCGGGNFCFADSATRAQMAVFLLRAKNGLAYTPPAATGTVFGDVPAGSFAAAWIEALAAASVTAGCGNGDYCPDVAVTRSQMAVFLLRTSDGPSYVPPPCTTPAFADVPCSSPFAPWVNELAHRGVTAGCGGGNYCGGSPVTRGQMAVFLTLMFLI